MSWKSLKFRQYWSYSGAKLNASDSDIVEALKSIHQSIMTKIKNYACEDWIVRCNNFSYSYKNTFTTDILIKSKRLKLRYI